MAIGRKTGGRKAGTPNKLTSTAKDTIAQCAALLEANGKTLYRWVDKDDANERIFWSQIYPKLLPLQISGDAENPLRIVTIKDDDAKL
jgi:hypothetical protein